MTLGDPFVACLAYVALTHYWADFTMQTNWMATNKSKSVKALSAHVGVYTGMMAIFAMSLALSGYFSLPGMFGFVLLNGALHFCVDFCTSKITSRYWSQNKMHEFFAVVGFDQLLHFNCLLITLVYFWEAHP